MWVEIVIFVIIFSILFYRWGTKNHEFFKKRNIPHEKAEFIFGGGREIIFRKKSIFQVQCEMYNRHDGLAGQRRSFEYQDWVLPNPSYVADSRPAPDDGHLRDNGHLCGDGDYMWSGIYRAFGAFDNRDPVLMLRDPELIKHVVIKDFDHFVNRRRFFGDSKNLLSSSLLLLENEKWRDMRSTLSPAFTGSKMRQMFQLTLQTVTEAMDYLREQQQNAANDQNGIELDVKEFTMRLTNDIIASTAFGLQVNSFRDRENEFYMRAKKAITFTGWQQMKALCLSFVPKIAKLFKVDLFDKEFNDYFMHLVLDTMKYRMEQNIHRTDMIQLLMEARGMVPSDTKKMHQREWSDLEVVAQCFLFFFAAVEPLSGAMSFAAHELMEYPDVQEQLYEEVQEVEQELEGKPITYEVLQKMSYMDMVVSEILRKWPVTLTVDRTCTKDFQYESAETGERIDIRKGELVRVGMCAIQRDPKYFEDPDVLNPERFSEENKSKIDSGTYMPFGLGPRNCIGNRMALLETKAFLYALIRDYRLEASPKTCLPVVLCTKNIQLRPKNGFWIQLKPRK